MSGLEALDGSVAQHDMFDDDLVRLEAFKRIRLEGRLARTLAYSALLSALLDRGADAGTVRSEEGSVVEWVEKSYLNHALYRLVICKTVLRFGNMSRHNHDSFSSATVSISSHLLWPSVASPAHSSDTV